MLGRGKRKKAAPAPKRARALFYIPRITADTGFFAEDQGDGYILAEILKALADRTGRALPALALQHPDTAVNEYVRNYNMVIVMLDHEGNKVCISADYRNQLPPSFVDRVRSFLQVMPDDTVLWAEDVFNTPRPAPAREVVYGQKPEKPPKSPTRKELAKKWQHPEALTPEEMSFLMGKSTKPPKP
jgi:hypothetical protein